jgi:hypothetical protein
MTEGSRLRLPRITDDTATHRILWARFLGEPWIDPGRRKRRTLRALGIATRLESKHSQ